MALQSNLQELLEMVLGSENVYSQPPPNTVMKYPAIVFKLDDIDNQFADNLPYRQTKRYQLTFMSRTSSVDVIDKIAALPLCRYSRFFVADGLNQHIFTLYF